MIIPYYQTTDADQTIRLGARLGAALCPGDAVFLFGELGAGKTHFVKGLAKGLGIQRIIKSPTYTFLHSYDTSSGPFHHYDLYRLRGRDEVPPIGYYETIQDPNAVHAVEWADRLEGDLPARRIEVHMEPRADHHAIRIGWVSPDIAPPESVEALWDEFATPHHIRDHCRAVARVAMRVGEAMVRALQIVDLSFTRTACLLHDVLRLVDFKPLNQEGRLHAMLQAYPLTASAKKALWRKWGMIYKQYHHLSHGEAAALVLRERGYPRTAEAVRIHQGGSLVREPGAFDTLEKKLVSYADKRVRHDQTVSIRERFADGRKRWFDQLTPDQEDEMARQEQAALRLERELFTGLSIRPEEIAF